MSNYRNILNRDIGQYQEGSYVCITGIIHNRWTVKGRFGVEITDLTGTVRVSFADSNISYDKKALSKGKRVRIIGKTMIDRKGNHCIGSVKKAEILEELSIFSNELDIAEQESLVMMSKICNTIRNHLIQCQFVEISTRVISRRIGDEILEPLLVNYPGFGSSVYLSPSSSLQLSEFLTVTLLPKVFSESSSFSSSYRFQNGATELPIIMAKGVNLTKEEEYDAIIKTTKLIVDSLSDSSIQINEKNDVWKENLTYNKPSDGVFSFVSYNTNFPTMGKLWNSIVYLIKRLEDDNGNLLVECMYEKLESGIDICSITFYPSQFLNWISKAPKRQLQNLWKAYDGANLYV